MPPPHEVTTTIVSINKDGVKNTQNLTIRQLREHINAESEQTQQDVSEAKASLSASVVLLSQQKLAAQKLRDHNSGKTRLPQEEVIDLTSLTAVASHDAQVGSNSALAKVTDSVGREGRVANGMHNTTIKYVETSSAFMSKQAENHAKLANMLDKTTPKSASHKASLGKISRAAFDLVSEDTLTEIHEGARDLKPLQLLSIKSSTDSPARSSSKSKPLEFMALTQDQQDELTKKLDAISDQGIQCEGCDKQITKAEIETISMKYGSVQKYCSKKCKKAHTEQLAKAKEDENKVSYEQSRADSRSRIRAAQNSAAAQDDKIN